MAISRPCGVYDTNYAQDFAVIRTNWQWGMTIAGLILFLTSPLFLNSSLVSLVNYICITIIVVQGLNIATGYAGQISLGQAAFMAVGAFTTGVLYAKFGVPWFLALLCAPMMAGVAGLIFALPAGRIKGFYLAISTLAAQFIIIPVLAHPLAPWTGGAEGMRIPLISLGGLALNTPGRIFYLVAPLTILMVFFAKSLVRTGVGRALVAIRDNDLAAEVMGINIFYYKVVALVISAAFAGIGGALLAFSNRAVHPEDFGLMNSIWFLGMLIVGGMGSISGACFGVIILRLLDYSSRMFGYFIASLVPVAGVFFQGAMMPLIYGLIILLFIIFEPRGLAHRWEIFKSSYRLRPFAY